MIRHTRRYKCYIRRYRILCSDEASTISDFEHLLYLVNKHRYILGQAEYDLLIDKIKEAIRYLQILED